MGDQFLGELFSYCFNSFSPGGECFQPLRNVIYKANKYLYPSVEGQILVKSVFPEFSGVLVSHSDPSWVHTHSVFWIYLDKNLAF